MKKSDVFFIVLGVFFSVFLIFFILNRTSSVQVPPPKLSESYSSPVSPQIEEEFIGSQFKFSNYISVNEKKNSIHNAQIIIILNPNSCYECVGDAILEWKKKYVNEINIKLLTFSKNLENGQKHLNQFEGDPEKYIDTAFTLLKRINNDNNTLVLILTKDDICVKAFYINPDSKERTHDHDFVIDNLLGDMQ